MEFLNFGIQIHFIKKWSPDFYFRSKFPTSPSGRLVHLCWKNAEGLDSTEATHVIPMQQTCHVLLTILTWWAGQLSKSSQYMKHVPGTNKFLPLNPERKGDSKEGLKSMWHLSLPIYKPKANAETIVKWKYTIVLPTLCVVYHANEWNYFSVWNFFLKLQAFTLWSMWIKICT